MAQHYFKFAYSSGENFIKLNIFGLKLVCLNTLFLTIKINKLYVSICAGYMYLYMTTHPRFQINDLQWYSFVILTRGIT